MEFFYLISSEGISFPLPLDVAIGMFGTLKGAYTSFKKTSYQLDFSAECIFYTLFDSEKKLKPTGESIVLIMNGYMLLDFLVLTQTTKFGDSSILSGSYDLKKYRMFCFQKINSLFYYNEKLTPNQAFPLLTFDFFSEMIIFINVLPNRYFSKGKIPFYDKLIENNLRNLFRFEDQNINILKKMFKYYLKFEGNRYTLGQLFSAIEIPFMGEEWVKEWKLLSEEERYPHLVLYINEQYQQGSLSELTREFSKLNVQVIGNFFKTVLSKIKEDSCSSCKRAKVDLLQDVESKLLYCSISCQAEYYALKDYSAND